MTFLWKATDRPGRPGTPLRSRHGILLTLLGGSGWLLLISLRAGHLDGTVTLPVGLRSLCPSGFAYAGRTALFVQMWQNWRAESGTGLAYFSAPPAPQTMIATAEGDTGTPQREVGDGWWWVA